MWTQLVSNSVMVWQWVREIVACLKNNGTAITLYFGAENEYCHKVLYLLQGTGYYLKQCWPNSLTHICIASGGGGGGGDELKASQWPFLAATKQLYEWSFPSVCLSVCLSVTPFWLCFHHRIIMKFSGVITNDKSDVHAKGQGQRSKVKVRKVNTQLNRFLTVTPVWIHIWWWSDAYSLMMLRRGALLFLKVIRQISMSHGSKKCQIWPKLGVSGL